MRYLSAEEISAIHHVVIEETGGSPGLREAGLLESLAQKPRATFGGKDLYPDIFLKAAVLYEGTVNYHVFTDGNKRTGFASMARFLSINGTHLAVTNKEIEEYTLQIATSQLDLADIAVWIKHHSQKVK